MGRPSALIHSAALISGAATRNRPIICNIGDLLFVRIDIIFLVAVLFSLHVSNLIANINGFIGSVDLLIHEYI